MSISVVASVDASCIGRSRVTTESNLNGDIINVAIQLLHSSAYTHIYNAQSNKEGERARENTEIKADSGKGDETIREPEPQNNRMEGWCQKDRIQSRSSSCS
jgi:hypothetical protein